MDKIEIVIKYKSGGVEQTSTHVFESPEVSQGFIDFVWNTYVPEWKTDLERMVQNWQKKVL